VGWEPDWGWGGVQQKNRIGKPPRRNGFKIGGTRVPAFKLGCHWGNHGIAHRKKHKKEKRQRGSQEGGARCLPRFHTKTHRFKLGVLLKKEDSPSPRARVSVNRTKESQRKT